MFNTNFKSKKRVCGYSGFFMLELIVAIFLFSIVMVVSMNALIIALDSNSKVQSFKSVLNNLNIAIETMTKTLAVGMVYHCDPGSTPSLTVPNDCSVTNGGGDSISFVYNANLGGNPSARDIIVYKFETDTYGKGYISRTLHLDDGTIVGPGRMTAPEVNIDVGTSRFYVTGSDLGYGNGGTDTDQPKVLIVVHGEALSGPRLDPSKFTVQTLVTERIPDF